MPSQEVRREIRFRQINQSSSMENLDCCPNHQHSLSLRLYICVCARRRARRGTWRWPLRRAWWALGGPQRRHHGGHAGSGLGGVTAGSIAREHFTNKNPCAHTDKISENCPQLGEKPWQTIPEKTQDRFESRFE